MNSMIEFKVLRKFRNQPITAVRFIRAVKYWFAEYVTVPRYVTPEQINAIHQEILKPLLGSNELKETTTSKQLLMKILQSMAGFPVQQLQPWIFSSAYTFAYFVINRRKTDVICMKAYDAMLKGNSFDTLIVRYIVNSAILEYGDVNAADDDKKRKALTKNEIVAFRKSLNTSHCTNELQVLAAWPEGMGFIYNSIECGNKENEMREYFKLSEINNKVLLAKKDNEGIADVLNDSENNGAEEGNVNESGLKNLNQVNSESNTSEKDCSTNIPAIKINSIKESNTKTNTAISNKIENIRLRQKNSNKNQDIPVNKENEIAKPVSFSTVNKKKIEDKATTIKINCSVDTSVSNTNLVESTIQLEIVTNSVTSNDIPVNKNNEIVEPIGNGTSNKNDTSINKKVTSQINLIKDQLLNKISKRVSELISQDTNLNADISTNDESANLVSKTTCIKKDGITDIKTTAAIASKNGTLATVICKEKENCPNAVDKIKHILAKQNTTFEACNLIEQLEDYHQTFHSLKSNNTVNCTASKSNSGSTLKTAMNQPPQVFPIMKKPRLDLKFSSSAVDLPNHTVTANSKLTDNNNKSDVTLEQSSIPVIDIDIEPSILNSKMKNQPLEVLSSGKKQHLYSRSNRELFINGTLEQPSIPVIDLESEPNMLDSKTINEQLQNPSNLEITCLDSSANSNSTVDIPIPVTNTNNNFNTKDNNSSSSKIKVIKSMEIHLENIDIKKNSSCSSSILKVETSSDAANVYSYAPDEIMIIEENLHKSSVNGKTATTINKPAIPLVSRSLANKKRSQRRNDALKKFSKKRGQLDWTPISHSKNLNKK